MRKFIKWFLIGFVVLAGFNGFRTPTTPKTPEEIAIQEQVAQEKAEREQKQEAQEKAERERTIRREAARRAYYEHPVVMAHTAARKLDGINAKHTGAIQAAIQSFQQYASSKGKSPVDKRAITNASLDFDNMARAYADITVPTSLPTAALLTAACDDLKNSAKAGTEAFLELQRIVEGKPGSLPLVNKKMSEATHLRDEGMKALNEAKKQLASIPEPEYSID